MDSLCQTVVFMAMACQYCVGNLHRSSSGVACCRFMFYLDGFNFLCDECWHTLKLYGEAQYVSEAHQVGDCDQDLFADQLC